MAQNEVQTYHTNWQIKSLFRYVWFGQAQSDYIRAEETTFKFKFELEATRQLWNHEECIYFGLACKDAAD